MRRERSVSSEVIEQERHVDLLRAYYDFKNLTKQVRMKSPAARYSLEEIRMAVSPAEVQRQNLPGDQLRDTQNRQCFTSENENLCRRVDIAKNFLKENGARKILSAKSVLTFQRRDRRNCS